MKIAKKVKKLIIIDSKELFVIFYDKVITIYRYENLSKI